MSVLKDYLRTRVNEAAAEITDEIVKSGALEKFKNPDQRTYNGVKMFSELTGLSEDDVKKAWEESRRRRAAREAK